MFLMPLFRSFLIFGLLNFSEKRLILPKIVQNCLSNIHTLQLPNVLSSSSKANRKLQIILPKLGHFSLAALIAKNAAAAEVSTNSVFFLVEFLFFGKEDVLQLSTHRQMLFSVFFGPDSNGSHFLCSNWSFWRLFCSRKITKQSFSNRNSFIFSTFETYAVSVQLLWKADRFCVAIGTLWAYRGFIWKPKGNACRTYGYFSIEFVTSTKGFW